jgi:hypothetical protein
VGYRVLVGAVIATHFAFLGYVVFGGYLAWRWRRAIVPHVLAVTWGAIALATPVSCPLTAAESALRRHGGLPALDRGGFIDHYIQGVWFPERYTWLVRIAVALLVALSWIGALLRWSRRGGLREHGEPYRPAARAVGNDEDPDPDRRPATNRP